jgi:hypothetical protein
MVFDLDVKYDVLLGWDPSPDLLLFVFCTLRCQAVHVQDVYSGYNTYSNTYI